MYHDILRNKNYIQKITDISGLKMKLGNLYSEIWEPKTPDEFIEIYFTTPLKLLKFVINKESNVKSYSIKLKDFKNRIISYTAIDAAEIDIYEHDDESIKSVMFIPLEKYDRLKPLDMRFRIYACTG